MMETKPTIPLHQFYIDAIRETKRIKWLRYGQVLMNSLCQVRQDLWERLVNTDRDPYYAESMGDPKFKAFIAYIEKHWYMPGSN